MSKKSRTTTRLHIDWTRCDARGLCTELLPELLTRDDWGYPLSRNGSREPGTEALNIYSELKDVYINIDPTQV